MKTLNVTCTSLLCNQLFGQGSKIFSATFQTTPLVEGDVEGAGACYLTVNARRELPEFEVGKTYELIVVASAQES